MSEFLDPLETRSPEAREQWLAEALPVQIAHAKKVAPYFGKLLADVDPSRVTSRAALAKLPVTRKSELAQLQRQAPPFGGLASMVPGAIGRIFVSAGPILDPEGTGPDWWRFARGMFAAGFGGGDLVYNA